MRLQNGQLVTSINHARQQKRICYAVLMSNGELGLVNVSIHESSTDKCLASGSRFEIVGLLNPKVGHLIEVRHTHDELIGPVEELAKQVVFHCGNKNVKATKRPWTLWIVKTA